VDRSRTSREELAGNKSSEQEQDPMASFDKGPMPLRGVKGHTTTTTNSSFHHFKEALFFNFITNNHFLYTAHRMLYFSPRTSQWMSYCPFGHVFDKETAK
jgi:hypothetical protein